ncbi:LPS export ABC transporter periplasmic protein LptC [Candidatus Uabimicrobium sp. HlEnr_7]|uniref:LPS export ABC transporter periplasmic protein LptC n=1 Tax=Candidatus Uabimicrobium helgolandensis TaxID=3095367 RepID=UPI003558A8DD
MKKTLIIFSGLSAISIAIIVVLADGILVTPQVSPVTEIETKTEAIMVLKTKEKEILLDKENRLEKVSHIHYNEKRQKEWEITCEKMRPHTKNAFFIEKPHCIYYSPYQKDSGEWKLSKTYTIDADSAILKKRKGEFNILILRKNVHIQGFSDDGLESTATTKILRIDFNNRILSTKAKIQLDKKQAVTVESQGMKTYLNSNEINFLENVKATLYKKGKNKEVIQINSRSKGKLSLQKISQERFVIIQKSNVYLTAAQAELRCELLRIELQQNVDKKMYARKFLAQDKVRFIDGNNRVTCEDFSQEIRSDEERIFIKKNAFIALEGNISLLSKKEQQNIEKIREKRNSQRIEGEAAKEIRWYKNYGAHITTENVYFVKNAKIREYSQNQVVTKINGDYLKLDTVISVDPKTQKEKREPLYLQAKKDVVYRDKKLEAKGEYCQWKKISATTDYLYIKGKKNNIAFFDVSGSGSKDTKKNEDIVISADAYITVKRHSSGEHFCRSKKNVTILRYLTGTKKQIGRFQSQKLVINFLQDKQKKKRFSLQKAVAIDEVIYHDEKIKAVGGVLTWTKKNNKENIVLQKNPKVIAYNVDLGSGQSSLLGADKKPKKSSSKSKKEDIELRAQKAIIIIKDVKDQSYFLSAREDVDLYRYQHLTSKQVGKFKAHFLSAKIVARELKSLKAEKEVYIEDAGRTASGDRLHIETLKDDSKKVYLFGHVVVMSDKSKITGNKLIITGKDKMIYVKENVKMFTNGAEGSGDRLDYSTKEELATLFGNPAQLQQIDTKTSSPNTLFAQKIIFANAKNTANAYGKVKMLFSNNGGGKGLGLIVDSKKTSEKSTQKKAKDFQLTCEEAQAFFESKSRRAKQGGDLLTSSSRKLVKFIAQKNVIISNRDDSTQQATGEKFSYFIPQKKAQLLGDKARLMHDGREIYSKHFDFHIDKKEAHGQGPITIILPRQKSEKKGQKFISGKTIKIISQGKISYLNNDEKIQLFDDIVATIGNRKLKCQRLEVILKKQTVEELIAYENVILIAEKNTVYGNQLRWNEAKKRVFIADYPYVRVEGEGTNIKAPMVFYDIETEYLYTRGHNIKATRLPQVKTKDKK